MLDQRAFWSMPQLVSFSVPSSSHAKHQLLVRAWRELIGVNPSFSTGYKPMKPDYCLVCVCVIVDAVGSLLSMSVFINVVSLLFSMSVLSLLSVHCLVTSDTRPPTLGVSPFINLLTNDRSHRTWHYHSSTGRRYLRHLPYSSIRKKKIWRMFTSWHSSAWY